MKLLWILFCLISPCAAKMSQSDLNKIAETLESNGFSELTLMCLQDDIAAKTTGLQLLKILHQKNIQTVVLKHLDQHENWEGNHLIYSVSTHEDWLTSLELAAHTRILSTIVITSMSTLTNLEKVDANVAMYMFDTKNASWLEVTMLKNFGEKEPIINAIPESGKGHVNLRPMFDFGWTSVKSSALDWLPYIAFTNCNEDGEHCQMHGKLASLIPLVESLLKLKIVASKPDSNDWGWIASNSIHSDFNDSNSVADLVFKREAHLSLSTWAMRADRLELFDLPSMTLPIRFLVVSKPSEMPATDFGLFVRPFTLESWLSILGLSLLITMIRGAMLRIQDFNPNNWSVRVALASGCIFWVVIHAFYSGALTMFFSNEAEPLFTSIEDVLEDFPNYRLIMVKHTFTTLQNDKSKSSLFSQYWERVQDDPGQYRVEQPLEGLLQVLNDKVVLEIDEQLFEQTTQHEQLEGKQFHIIEKTAIAFSSALLMTQNSPLTPAFEHAFRSLRENGILAKFILGKGVNPNLKETKKDEVQALGLGQLILAYVIVGLGILSSIFMLVAEMVVKHALRKWKCKMNVC